MTGFSLLGAGQCLRASKFSLGIPAEDDSLVPEQGFGQIEVSFAILMSTF